MIVYGDPQYRETLSNLLRHLLERLQSCLSLQERDPQRLEQLRALLIMCGQTEQAAHDDLLAKAPAAISHLHAATTHLARAFYSAWQAYNGEREHYDIGESLQAAEQHLESISPPKDAVVTAKLPEGFAFYALFPEQYCLSAQRWLAKHAGEEHKHAAVVGIRSTGTTLAAVVSAVLEAGGWQVSSFTVRPTGHPFERHVDIDPTQLEGATWALVVDEGPGMSGSSMAAVGEALVRAGIRRGRISFFPGHSGEPGSTASDRVREWWQTTPRYVTPLSEVRFGGRPLAEHLAYSFSRDKPEQFRITSIEDVGGGQWRKYTYKNESEWPAVAIPFERPKYRCTQSDGGRVLLKFEGLCSAPGGKLTTAEAVEHLLSARGAAEHITYRAGDPEPARHEQTVMCGFVAQAWHESRPMTRACISPSMLDHIGSYIATVMAQPLTPDEQRAGIERLSEMLYWNTWEALGEEWAERTRATAAAMLDFAQQNSLPSYGDGHMAPHEWLLRKNGRIAKVDSVGHAWDHTCIGPQSVAWGVAGALVEWRLNSAQQAALLQAFHVAGGPHLPPEVLHFHRLAYAAFRLGQCHICANMLAHDPNEQQRLWTAYAEYKGVLSWGGRGEF